MNMRILTLAIAGGAMLLSAPLATVATAKNMVDGNKCQLLKQDLKWDLMLITDGSAKYAGGAAALEEAEAAYEKGQHAECVAASIKGIESLDLPVNEYPA
jgi:hypothetical protein